MRDVYVRVYVHVPSWTELRRVIYMTCACHACVGVAINFVKQDDIRILRDIEQFYGTQIDEMPMNG